MQTLSDSQLVVVRDIDVEIYFFKQRRWFFSVFLVAWLLDIPETLSKGDISLRDVPAGYAFYVAFNLSLGVVGLVTENRAVHLALPVIWLSGVLVFVGGSTMGIIAN